MENKYYIGKTNNIENRILSHFTDNGSEWTKKYKPIKIKCIIPNCDNEDEDKETIKLMREKGIDNVRGGNYCKIILNQQEKTFINKIIRGNNDLCFICGSNSHFSKECNKQKYTQPNHITDNINNTSSSSMEIICERCGRHNHNANNCYATTDINKNILTCIEDVVTSSIVTSSSSSSNTNYPKNKKNSVSNQESPLIICERCGRHNHNANDCYATTDINKNILTCIEDVVISSITTSSITNTNYPKNKKNSVSNQELPLKINNDINFNCKYCNKEFLSQKGTTYHENFYCKNKKK